MICIWLPAYDPINPFLEVKEIQILFEVPLKITLESPSEQLICSVIVLLCSSRGGLRGIVFSYGITNTFPTLLENMYLVRET